MSDSALNECFDKSSAVISPAVIAAANDSSNSRGHNRGFHFLSSTRIRSAATKTRKKEPRDPCFDTCSSLQAEPKAPASQKAPCHTCKVFCRLFCCLGDAPRQLALPPCRDLTQASVRKQAQTSGQSTSNSPQGHRRDPRPIPHLHTRPCHQQQQGGHV